MATKKFFLFQFHLLSTWPTVLLPYVVDTADAITYCTCSKEVMWQGVTVLQKNKFRKKHRLCCVE